MAEPRYEIPPWLRATDTTSPYLSGVKTGASIAQEHDQLQAQLAMQNQKLAQQQQEDAQAAQQFQQQLQQKSQDSQRQADLDQQRLAITGQYQQQQSQLKQQALQQGQQKIKMASDHAAQRYDTEVRIAKRIEAGEDPSTVYVEEGPKLVSSFAGLAPIIKGMQATAPAQDVQAASVLDPITHAPMPNVYTVKSASGGQETRNKPADSEKKAQVTARDKAIKKTEAAIKNMEEKSYYGPWLTESREPGSIGKDFKAGWPKAKATYDGLKKELETLENSSAGTGTGTTRAPSGAASEKDPLGLFK